MLSNPPQSGLHARNRQHRRQNSTPTGYDTMKIATNLPNIQPSPLRPQHTQYQQQRSRVAHRRGMSLDTRRQMLSQKRQSYGMVSNTNNSTGSATTPQHVVREAQQQRIARPGPQQAYANLATDENYLVSPGATPQLQCFDQQWTDGLPLPSDLSMVFDMYPGSMDVIIKEQQDGYPSSLDSPDFDLFPQSAMSTPTMMNFQDSMNGVPGWLADNSAAQFKRRVSNGIADRVSKFENLSQEPLQRPLTPPKQNEIDYFPMTPMETPQVGSFEQTQPPQRFVEGYDESNEETVKPIRQKANRRSQTIFDEMRQATESLTIVPETRRANTMPTNASAVQPATSVPEYLAMNHSSDTDLRIDTNNDGFQGPSYPSSARSEYSQHMSPVTPNMNKFEAFDFSNPESDPQAISNDMLSDVASSSATEKPSSQTSHHRRTESVASLASAASIATIDIESTKTVTGITLEDIQQYIEGPDPKDNKWICTFEDCNKKFGRKENIKSHVQTHLNDRQFKCPACQKCFVRQHDLKRHAKIHTGIKPYPCLCGNSFARHDALTRHRQRGMCIGAFEGSAPKNAKRGRPRKPRPENEERREKACRTRRKNKSVSSVSSIGTCSDVSAATSPEEEMNEFDLMEDVMDVSLGGTTLNPSSLQSMGSSAPMPALDAASPSSIHSYSSRATPHSSADLLPPHHSPSSPARSITSAVNDPPELTDDSSPLATQYFDMSEPGLDAMISSASDISCIPTLGGSNESSLILECDMFGSSASASAADVAKFEDAYDGVDMFTSHDDLIFGH
ncbi:hypothetical protein F5B22DRAFT_322979 [Xylaria bambusicola]|uniref:uncharacterized protein n=1 Tax=Xylaria bambusicola TaxID=326684 RepID=UPI0020080D1F|nr:uncharacterized protein F5B22DRAFT_322979 [Xylaria bambusicola]KAI0509486.1 hypothetical protein F5B22DRAFT_322979 [Xylaria bambusicola]